MDCFEDFQLLSLIFIDYIDVRKRAWEISVGQDLPTLYDAAFLLDFGQVKVVHPLTRSEMIGRIGDLYGLRTEIEYGLKQCKDALGWADFRVTHYEQIEKWWEIVMSAFLMVSLFADVFNDTCPLAHQHFAQHPWRDKQGGWKNLLNNWRLIIQPLMSWNLLKSWLEGFPLSALKEGFDQLTSVMDQFFCLLVRMMLNNPDFSSA